jgi:hypothetical protein
MPFVRVLLNETAVFAGETKIESAVTGYAVNTRGEYGFVADRRKQQWPDSPRSSSQSWL